jgi:phosphohistidine phosphatase
MKTLILVRHAKSDWSDSSQDDFARPLNRRGERDAPVMAERLAKLHLAVDAVWSSPAVRALATAEIIARRLEVPLQTDPLVYEASARRLFEIVGALDDRQQAVVLVGHNPGLSGLLQALIGGPTPELPTAAIAVVELSLESWKNLATHCGVLRHFLFPKQTTNA